jgi:hypothetical protein
MVEDEYLTDNHALELTVAIGKFAVNAIIVKVDNLLLQLILDAIQKVVKGHVPLRDT